MESYSKLAISLFVISLTLALKGFSHGCSAFFSIYMAERSYAVRSITGQKQTYARKNFGRPQKNVLYTYVLLLFLYENGRHLFANVPFLLRNQSNTEQRMYDEEYIVTMLRDLEQC